MPAINFSQIVIYLFLFMLFAACNERDSPQAEQAGAYEKVISKQAFRTTMQKHLDAVSNKDLATLASTLSPEGNMQLILPGDEIVASVDSFLAFHEAWFQDTTWTFTTKILNVEVGTEVGMAVTEVVYREPDRDGVPYFNRMIVSYTLRKMDGEWYVIKDHATSAEKSTDKQ